MSRAMIKELNERSRQVFREIVDAYLTTGEPVGSRFLAQISNLPLSAASFRNIMAELEGAGLLYAPHTSAGRMPTETGLRLFVDGLLEVGDLTSDERAAIEGHCHAEGKRLEEVLAEATSMLSGLSMCAGVVLAPKADRPLKHIEFVPLGPGRALVVIVTEDGMVENRLIDLPLGLPPSALVHAGNYLSARLAGRTIEQVGDKILAEIEQNKAELDDLSARVVGAGLATWAGGETHDTLIVRGRSNLLSDITAIEDLERIRKLFDDLETKKELMRLLELSRNADGVRIFIGSENNLFSLSGSSLIVSPYMDGRENIVGVIGVIGPTRVNYAKVIPLVDYTAEVIGRILS
ncbi:MAG: heat-inducible transcriptional repressor HrcA [Sphingomonadales bacterium]